MQEVTGSNPVSPTIGRSDSGLHGLLGGPVRDSTIAAVLGCAAGVYRSQLAPSVVQIRKVNRRELTGSPRWRQLM
jgi:hypothetical protein